MSVPLPSARLIHLLEVSVQRGDLDVTQCLEEEGAAVVHTAAYHIQKLVGASPESRFLHLEDLIRCMKLLRNLCFASTICSTLVPAGAVRIVADTIDAIGAGIIPADSILPVAIAQLAANLTNDSAAAASSVWTSLFPHRFLTLTCIELTKVHAATTLALLNCCRCIPGAAQKVIHNGALMLTALLDGDRKFSERGECNDNLPLFLGYLVFSCGLLEDMFIALSGSHCRDTTPGALPAGPEQGSSVTAGLHLTRFVAPHSMLLHELAVEMQEAPQCQWQLASSDDVATGGILRAGSGRSIRYLVCLLRHLCTNKSTPLNACEQQILQDALHLMRDIAARDDAGLTVLPPNDELDLVVLAVEAGLLRLLLCALKSLGPPRNPRRDDPSQLASEVAPGLADEAAFFIAKQPYAGYRSDLLAVLGNAAHGRQPVQEAIAALGGVELILAQCQVDKESPLAREWALWAVRNVCEGSDAAREAIRELQLCEALDSEELKRAGVRLKLDPESGKLRLMPRDSQ